MRRSEFDEILIRRSAQQGAQVLEGCRVRDVEPLPEGRPDGMRMRVEAENDDGSTASWLARYVIDASGRDTVLGNRLATKRRNSRHNSAALYGHFRHADRYPEAKRAGNISIYWFEHGWFWFIPLSDGVTSIGAVVWPYYLKCRKVPVRQFFLDTIAMCAPLAARLQNAELISDARGHRQLLLFVRSVVWPRIRSCGRCVHIHRPDVLIRRVDGDGQWNCSSAGRRHIVARTGPIRCGNEGIRSRSCAMARSSTPGSSIASPTPPCAICSWRRVMISE